MRFETEMEMAGVNRWMEAKKEKGRQGIFGLLGTETMRRVRKSSAGMMRGNAI